MRYTVPHYYKKFRCTASECQDTCCAGWQIMIDERSLKAYKKQKGPLGNRLHNSIDWREQAFRQYEGRCAFLDEHNLCDLYSEGGPDLLCRTCRHYPRHIEEFEGVREISLSLSCPEAARLILGCEEPVRFLTKESKKEEDYEEFDFLLYTKLNDARDLMIQTLQDRTQPMDLRTAMVLALAHDMQSRISKQKLFLMDSLFERFGRSVASDLTKKKLMDYRTSAGSRYQRMKEMFGLFSRLEVLKKDWRDYVGQIIHTLYHHGPEAYNEQRRQFCHGIASSPDRKKRWEIWEEQLMVYFIFTYFSGAVYDEQAYGKVKFAVVSTLLVKEMAQAVWQQRGGQLEFEDMLDIVHRYSREVEHSDRNLGIMERILGEDSRFDLEHLLGFL